MRERGCLQGLSPFGVALALALPTLGCGSPPAPIDAAVDGRTPAPGPCTVTATISATADEYPVTSAAGVVSCPESGSGLLVLQVCLEVRGPTGDFVSGSCDTQGRVASRVEAMVREGCRESRVFRAHALATLDDVRVGEDTSEPLEVICPP